jgi:hypothetical protein
MYSLTSSELYRTIAANGFLVPHVSMFTGCPVISLETTHAKIRHCYGRVRLGVMVAQLASVLVFLKTNGQSTDASELTDEDIAVVLDHLKDSRTKADSFKT